MSTINYINASLEIFSCVISAIVAICLIFGKQVRTKSGRWYLAMLACNAGSQFFDVCALWFRGNTSVVNWWGVRIANFSAYALNYLLLLVFICYITEYVGERTKVSNLYLNTARVICTASWVLLIVSQFQPIFYSFDAQNMYHRAPFFWVSQMSGIICMVICIAFLLRYGKYLNTTEKTGFWAYVVMPIVALAIQMFAYGLVLVNLANTISLTLIFLFLQTELGRREEEQRKQIAQQDNQLTQSRMAIMLSQIQPHFLYNALLVIQELCNTDPKEAEAATIEFSKFLRGNMDSLSADAPIPFEKEIDHTRHYLALEQKRFGKKLRVEWNLQSTAFFIPALTLQPIVENAVRYGVTKKKGGGTVSIESYEDQNDIKIVIRDDGVGFDITKPKDDGRTHIGIANVKKRLNDMCGGTLHMESEENVGTIATIILPKGGTPRREYLDSIRVKGGEQHEYYSSR